MCWKIKQEVWGELRMNDSYCGEIILKPCINDLYFLYSAKSLSGGINFLGN